MSAEERRTKDSPENRTRCQGKFMTPSALASDLLVFGAFTTH